MDAQDELRVDSDAARILLVFDGVKMGASVNLNHRRWARSATSSSATLLM